MYKFEQALDAVKADSVWRMIAETYEDGDLTKEEFLIASVVHLSKALNDSEKKVSMIIKAAKERERTLKLY